MSTDPQVAPPAVLVLGHGPLHQQLVDEVESGLGFRNLTTAFQRSTEALEWMASNPERTVSWVVVLAGLDDVDEVMQEVTALPSGAQARLLLVTDRAEHQDIAWVIDQDKLDGVLTVPWEERTLRRVLAGHVRRHRESRAAAPPAPPMADAGVIESQLLANLALGQSETTAKLLEAIEEVLGPRPRLHLPPQVRVIHEDDDVNAVLLVLHGRVAMSMRSRAGEVLLHHASTGPVVGLLSMADRQRAFVTARTTTSAEVVHLTIEQLDRALRESPAVGAALTAVSIRILSARLRRAQNLHVEKFELAAELETERERLSAALSALEKARTQLISQARFATLGELSAGIAHELNNPIAAVVRAVDHLSSDVTTLLATHPHGEFVTQSMERARTRQALSTKEERRRRRDVAQVVGDAELARRLVAIGIHDAQAAADFLDSGTRGWGRKQNLGGAQKLQLAELASGIGASLRNLELAGDHVRSLVGSLRSHARPDSVDTEVDVANSLSDAVRLTGNRLTNATVDLEIDTGLPPVRGRAAALGQVWTNLLINAADATADSADPTITLTAHRAQATEIGDGPAAIVVRVRDNGRGIDPENIERIFQPQFTTKHGTVRYGLGMGLGISRSIIEEHNGSITVDSAPGATTFTIILPTHTSEPGSPPAPGPTEEAQS